MKKIALGLAAVLLSGTANAATIVSYDITGATLSGFGNWAHTYNGTITPTGGSAANYAGGSGTLNDGTPGTSTGNHQLFDRGFAPVITLKLDGTYKVSSLSFLTNAPNNVIPGSLTKVDVTIGGNTETVNLTDFGGANANTFLPNDLATLGALLSNTATNKIVLSNFVSGGSLPDYFAIGEIEVAGTAAGGVPEPAAWAMMLAGFGLVGGAMRRREKMTVTFA